MAESDSTTPDEKLSLSECEDFEQTLFSVPGKWSDVVLVVDGEKLHASSHVLALASPVFKDMIEGEYKDKEIPIHENTSKAVTEFLSCIYPGITNPISRDTLDDVLSLADVYQVDSLKSRCEEFVLNRFKLHDERLRDPPNTELVHFFYLADKYKMKKLLAACIEMLKFRPYDGVHGIRSVPEFASVSVDSKLQVLSERIIQLEAPLRGLIAEARKETLTPSSQHMSTSGFSLGSVQTTQVQPQNMQVKNIASMANQFRHDPLIWKTAF